MDPIVKVGGLPQSGSQGLDDDGRPKRTGTVWTASAHIITAVVGSGVLSLAWAIAQLGWIAGLGLMILFAIVTYLTSNLLSDCYRVGDAVTGRRIYSYTDAVRSNLGGFRAKICSFVLYSNLCGIAIGYTIASTISMMAIQRSNCFHQSGQKDGCHARSTPYMLAFASAEIILSQFRNFNQLWWLSIVAAAMSFMYSSVALGLGIGKLAENGTGRGSLNGTHSPWRVCQALGNIAFAYSYSLVIFEVQDTIKSPSEAKTMKKATLISVTATTIFFMLCGSMGYAAFGDASPGNLLAGFGFYNPYWLIDLANAAIVIHLACAYQVFVQPFYALVEKAAAEKFPESQFISKNFQIPIPGVSFYKLNLFRLLWRTSFVSLVTFISMLLPFFNDVVAFLGALGFFPLSVYFPIEMYISQKKIQKWSCLWVYLRAATALCFIVTLAAVVGSIAGIVSDLKTYKPFHF